MKQLNAPTVKRKQMKVNHFSNTSNRSVMHSISASKWSSAFLKQWRFYWSNGRFWLLFRSWNRRRVQHCPISFHIKFCQSFQHFGIGLALLLAEFPKTNKDFWCEVGRKGTSTRWHGVTKRVLAKIYHSCRGAIFTHLQVGGDFSYLIFLGDFFVMRYMHRKLGMV